MAKKKLALAMVLIMIIGLLPSMFVFGADTTTSNVGNDTGISATVATTTPAALSVPRVMVDGTTIRWPWVQGANRYVVEVTDSWTNQSFTITTNRNTLDVWTIVNNNTNWFRNWNDRDWNWSNSWWDGHQWRSDFGWHPEWDWRWNDNWWNNQWWDGTQWRNDFRWNGDLWWDGVNWQNWNPTWWDGTQWRSNVHWNNGFWWDGTQWRNDFSWEDYWTWRWWDETRRAGEDWDWRWTRNVTVEVRAEEIVNGILTAQSEVGPARTVRLGWHQWYDTRPEPVAPEIEVEEVIDEEVIEDCPPPCEAPVATLRFEIGSTFYTVEGGLRILDAAPFIDPAYNRTMVPLRAIAEGMGAEVGWNSESRVVSIRLDGMTLLLSLDEPLPSGMGMPAIVNNRTFVPVRYIAETLGATVGWNSETRAVYIY